MSSERYHKAARDGYLDLLNEASKRDLNSKDEDGMTPTLWAAFEGNLDALRLIVGRGGDPDKCDNYGNTALHFSAARGHIHCVSFLVNFGVNMWAMDIDFHTPKDLAAINNKEHILRFLDAALGKEEVKDRKKVKSLQEKAEKEAQKRVKEFDKLQKKASKNVEEEAKKLAKQRQKMEKGGATLNTQSVIHRPVIPFMSLRNKEPPHSPKFSEIVSSNTAESGTIVSKLRPGHFTGVYKKVQQKKSLTGTTSEFKIAEVELDGKRSVRSLSGLRRDNEVMYVPKYEISSSGGGGKRGKINGLFDANEGNTLSRSVSQPDYLNQSSSSPRDEKCRLLGGTEVEFYDDHRLPHNTASIFERPGFGSVAFRSSLTASLGNFTKDAPARSNNESRNHIQKHIAVLHEENFPSEEDEEDEASSELEENKKSGAIELFLAAAGISNYISIFLREKIDLDALMLLHEEDLTTLGIPMGPRRKLLKSIQDREKAFKNPGEIIDSRL